MNRREAISLLGVGALTVRAADQPLRFGSLDHLEFFVSDLQKSLTLYTRVFGNGVWKNKQTARRYLKLGSAYIAMEQRPDNFIVDHFCAGILDFDVKALHTYLDQRGIAYRDYPSGRDLAVTDPDGTRLQLAADSSWGPLSVNTAAPGAFPSNGEPVVHATGLDHILLNVSDPAKSAAFYEQIFGPVERGSFAVGTSRLRLRKTPAGEKPGVAYFGVAVESFDVNMVRRALSWPGPGDPEFRDPDGYRVQIVAP